MGRFSSSVLIVVALFLSRASAHAQCLNGTFSFSSKYKNPGSTNALKIKVEKLPFSYNPSSERTGFTAGDSSTIFAEFSPSNTIRPIVDRMRVVPRSASRYSLLIEANGYLNGGGKGEDAFAISIVGRDIPVGDKPLSKTDLKPLVSVRVINLYTYQVIYQYKDRSLSKKIRASISKVKEGRCLKVPQ